MWGRPAGAPPARFDRPIASDDTVAACAGGRHCRPEGDRRSPLRWTWAGRKGSPNPSCDGLMPNAHRTQVAWALQAGA
jgi:hypothetical protein